MLEVRTKLEKKSKKRRKDVLNYMYVIVLYTQRLHSMMSFNRKGSVGASPPPPKGGREEKKKYVTMMVREKKRPKYHQTKKSKTPDARPQ